MALFGRLTVSPAFEAGSSRLQRLVKKRGLDVGVERHHVEQIERPAIEFRARRGGTVGDTLHFLEVFAVESSQEEGVGDQPEVVPGVRGCPDAAIAASSPINSDISFAIKRPC